MKEPKDRRTKEYKDWKSQQPSKGVGDTVTKVLKATGIKQTIDLIFDKLGVDCKCDENEEALNKLLPYRMKSRCLTKQEYIDWDDFVKIRTLNVSPEQQNSICKLYASLFNKYPVYEPCANCSPKILIYMIAKIDTVYEYYKSNIK